MSKQIKNDNALCLGMDTNLFYLEEDALNEKKTSLLSLRAICYKCPIRLNCLEYGFKYERYGMFGGLTGEERRLVRKKLWNNPKSEKLIKDLNILNRSINEIVEISLVEYQPIGGKDEQ